MHSLWTVPDPTHTLPSTIVPAVVSRADHLAREPPEQSPRNHRVDSKGIGVRSGCHAPCGLVELHLAGGNRAHASSQLQPGLGTFERRPRSVRLPVARSQPGPLKELLACL